MLIHREAQTGEKLRTLWCGGINSKVTEEVLYELFLNAGPLERVTIPVNFMSGQPRSFGYVVFQHEESVNFAYKLLNGVQLHGSKIRLQPHFMTKGVIADGSQQDCPGVNRSDFAMAPPSPSPAPLRYSGCSISFISVLLGLFVISIHYHNCAYKRNHLVGRGP